LAQHGDGLVAVSGDRDKFGDGTPDGESIGMIRAGRAFLIGEQVLEGNKSR
jgi:hypothetical protein